MWRCPHRRKPCTSGAYTHRLHIIDFIMAEREGFEPSIEFPLYTLSKRAPSTTRPSLRRGGSHQNSMRAARDRRMENVARCPISRRTLLLFPALALAGCRKPKATRFPGYCFVANQDGRSVAVVDLISF